jgi:Ca2+-binding EF-hand superfamily protein
LSEIFRFVETFRERDGLTRHEEEEIDAAFRRYDRDGKGQIMALEVGKLLRWIGYATNFDVQTHLVEMVDLERQGKLSLSDMRKLIRLFRENEVAKVRDVFLDYADGRATISGVKSRSAITSLGLTTTNRSIVYDRMDDSSSSDDEGEEPTAATRAIHRSRRATGVVGGVDVYHFVDVVSKLQEEMRAKFRDNAGFTDNEVHEMRTRFQKYDVDKSGDISNSELRLLLQDLFPGLATSPKLRPYLLRLLMEVDENSDGQLDFPDFMRLMRQVHDLQEHDRHDREVKLLEEGHFSREEVDQFRELFTGVITAGGVQGRNTASLSEITQMLGAFVPLDKDHVRKLKEILKEIVRSTEGAGHISSFLPNEADFPDFLLLMRRLLDDNFAQINDWAGRAVEKAKEARVEEAEHNVRSRRRPQARASRVSFDA